MSTATDELRELADGDRFEANLIRYLIAVGEEGPNTSLSLGQAEVLDATADGWTAIADAADKASGEVEDPEA